MSWRSGLGATARLWTRSELAKLLRVVARGETMGVADLVKRASLAAAAVFGAMLIAPAAGAADPNFCRDYAAAAVRQFNAAFAVPRCRGAMNGPRWSAEFRIHYDWCLGAPYDAASRERDVRRQYIDACR